MVAVKGGNYKSNLPKCYLDPNSPESKARNAKPKKKWADRKTVHEEAFQMSKLSDPKNQQKIFDKLFEDYVTTGNEKSLDILVKMGLLRAPDMAREVPRPEPEITSDEALDFLEKAAKGE